MVRQRIANGGAALAIFVLPFAVWCFRIWYEPANLDELEAESFDLCDYTEQRGLVR
jgi:hypothetical protein